MIIKILYLILSAVPITDRHQEHAIKEAEMMAHYERVEHFLGCSKGARFSGVGRSRSPEPKTCYPWEFNNPARKIIADAIIYKDGWYYRSTHWQ
jgi:hypothetical protein